MKPFIKITCQSFLLSLLCFLFLTCAQKTYHKAYEGPSRSKAELAYIYKNNHLCQIDSINGKNYVDKNPSNPAEDINVIIEITTGPHKVNIRPSSTKFTKYLGSSKEIAFEAKAGHIYLLEAVIKNKTEVGKKDSGSWKQVTYDVSWYPEVRDITHAKWSYWGGMDANYKKLAERMIQEKYGK